MNTINAKAMVNPMMLQQLQGYSNNAGMGDTKTQEQPRMSAQFSKTEMCKFHLLGTCRKGTTCAFAHSKDEMKERPDLSRTRLCRAFLQTGQCNNKNCTYAHSKDELRATGNFHKTKLCRFWPVGHCTLGAKCRFAHSTDELQATEEAEVAEQSPQQDQQYKDSMAIQSQILPLLAQLQALQQQQMQSLQWRQQHQQRSQKETYSGCATPEPSDFDTPPMQAAHLATLQHLLVNGKPRMTSTTKKLVSDREDSVSTFSDCPDSDSYESSTPEFPPNYGEGTKPLRMAPPNMQRMPVLLVPVQQMNQMTSIENACKDEPEDEPDSGNAIGDHAGAVEVMQAPVADEYPIDPLDDIWQRGTNYQVKNTFISIKEEPTFYPLRCVRSAVEMSPPTSLCSLADMRN